MADVFHEESGMRSTVPATYDAEFILEQAGNPNHSGWMENEDGTKLIAYHVNDQVAVQAIIDDYEALYVEQVAKPEMWAAVKVVREAKENSPAQTPLGPVDSDEKSKVRVLGLVQMAVLANQAGDETFSEEFTMADNTTIMLTANQAIALGVALGKNISDIHKNSRDLRAAINAATTFAELEAIDINEGWPN